MILTKYMERPNYKHKKLPPLKKDCTVIAENLNASGENAIEDFYFITPASLLGASTLYTNRRSGDRFYIFEKSNSSDENLEVEDYHDSLVKSLKYRLRFLNNQQNVSDNQKYLDNVHQSWANIYHNQVKQDFQYIDNSVNLKQFRNSIDLIKRYETTNGRSMPLAYPTLKHVNRNIPTSNSLRRASNFYNNKTQTKGLNRKYSQYVKKLDSKNSSSYLVKKVEAPGVCIKLIMERKGANEEKIHKFVNKNTENVKLLPTLLDQLKLNEMNTMCAKDFYFHPKTLSFTPYLISSESKNVNLKK